MCCTRGEQGLTGRSWPYSRRGSGQARDVWVGAEGEDSEGAEDTRGDSRVGAERVWGGSKGIDRGIGVCGESGVGVCREENERVKGLGESTERKRKCGKRVEKNVFREGTRGGRGLGEETEEGEATGRLGTTK